MNRRSVGTIAAAALALSLVLFWGLIPWRVFTSEPAGPRNVEAAEASISATPSASIPTQEAERKQKQEERAKRIGQDIEGTNAPINFWGHVIDQNEQPVAGVKVNYSYFTEHGNGVGVAWAQQRVHRSETTTNESGSFSITGLRGHELTIESLVKEGYQYTPRRSATYNFYGKSLTGKFIPDENKPVLFVMVNKATADPLVSYGGDFGKTMRLPGDGTPTRWNLWKGEPDPGGELQIRFKREPTVLARVGPPASWSAKIELIGGGIVEADPDELIHRAPEQRYAPTVDYPKAEQKRGVSARSFYIKTADGKYGRIQLHIYPGDDGPTARCLIKAYLNPSGSRNLESTSESR